MSQYQVPDTLLYTKDHEWARDEGDGVFAIGITDFAQDALGDITFVELPEIGRTLALGETFGVVESVKTFSDLYAPLSGEIVAVNQAVSDDATLINESPYESGWIVKVRASDPTEVAHLLSAAAYRDLMG